MFKTLQKGLSLVELMISLAVGSIITVGIVQLFGANSETYNVMMGQSRMQESARFALDFISRDIQKAGYRGCFSNNEQMKVNINNPDLNTPYEFDLREAVRGYNAAGVDIWSPALTELPNIDDPGSEFVNGTGIDLGEVITGTDVLTLRNAVQQDVEVRLAVNNTPQTDPLIVISPPDGVAGLGFGELDLALVHDCEKATIFHVTDIDDTTNAPNITLQHTLLTDPWANADNFLAIKNIFEDDAYVSGIETNIYFIAPGTGMNNVGETPLSLWRKAGTSAPVELVEGIEDLQVLFGVSTDGDSTPNQYLLANEVLDWKEVTMIRVTVVANTIDDVGGSSTPTHGCTVQQCLEGEPANGVDGLMRRAFTQTVKLRNFS